MTWEDFDNKIEYGKSEQWLIQGKKCNVVIKHRTTHDEPQEHHWNLYAIIFQSSKYWAKACDNKNDYDLDLGNELYGRFHRGCTYYNKQLTYVKIGCDYMHIDDEWFMQSSEMPEEVKQDAMDLFNYFNEE